MEPFWRLLHPVPPGGGEHLHSFELDCKRKTKT